MKSILKQLKENIFYTEGLQACLNCGTCSAICPAAEYYNYDPREIVEIVQRENETEIELLLKSDTIWYCGECMSCRTRCPRNNAPGLIIMALRAVAQEMGYFVESEKGRQQAYLKRSIGDELLQSGYCINAEGKGTQHHPELGPIWDWRQKHWEEIMERLGANYKKQGPGTMRQIPEETLSELRKIFEMTGGLQRFEKIEFYSEKKAREMGYSWDSALTNDYFRLLYEGELNNGDEQ